MTLKQLQSFVKWLRAERITYTSISAGGVTLDGVVDGKLEREAAKEKPEARQSAYERYGADLLKQPAAKVSERTPEEAELE